MPSYRHPSIEATVSGGHSCFKEGALDQKFFRSTYTWLAGVRSESMTEPQAAFENEGDRNRPGSAPSVLHGGLVRQTHLNVVPGSGWWSGERRKR